MKRRGRLLESLLGSLFPPACVECGTAVADGEPPVCRLCRTRWPLMAAPVCPRCGATAPGIDAEGPCAECREWDGTAPPCRTACRMEGPAATVVRALKYSGWTGLAPAMADAMIPAVRELGRGDSVLVPVPLTAARLRERGFNQARLLAEALARATGRPVQSLLVRRGGRRSQARLARSARRANVEGAFVPARQEPRPEAPAGQDPPHGSVLLVDDVITTGATVTACAAAVEAAGLRCVGAVGFARTLPSLHGA